MSLASRGNDHWPERRDDEHEGQIPRNWDARIVDIDRLAVAFTPTEGRIWVPYEQYKGLPGDVEPIAIIERKKPGETAGYRVTQKLAAMARLPWWLVVGPLDGDLYRMENANGVGVTGTLAELTAAIEIPARLALREAS